jgi:hypothetical protein
MSTVRGWTFAPFPPEAEKSFKCEEFGEFRGGTTAPAEPPEGCPFGANRLER